jgi:hypothetical protein
VLAVAQADHPVSLRERNLLEQLMSLESLGSWDRLTLLEEELSSPSGLDELADVLEDDADRRYALSLCFAMALADGISPPETSAIRQLAARFGVSGKALAACREEGEAMLQKLG